MVDKGVLQSKMQRVQAGHGFNLVFVRMTSAIIASSVVTGSDSAMRGKMIIGGTVCQAILPTSIHKHL